ncbi:MAG: CHAD domain-containing protein, partial [Candidatus Competibacterales bacterium]
ATALGDAPPILDPNWPAEEALALFLGHQRHNLLVAEVGLFPAGGAIAINPNAAPWQPSASQVEALHDYRVALRRSRSALAQFRGVFKGHLRSSFGAAFQALGWATGPARDLDVLLLVLDDYLQGSDLSPEGLDALNRDLQTRRALAWGEVSRTLNTPAYGETMASWRALLTDPPVKRGGRLAGRPIAKLAQRQAQRLYGRIFSEGKVLDQNAPAEAFHELRKRCKKLRYLLEFSRGLADATALGAQVKALKQLQGVLGHHQDLAVQGALLIRGADALSHRDRRAIQDLAATVDERQQSTRRAFAAAFAQFKSPAPRERVEALFAAGSAALVS